MFWKGRIVILGSVPFSFEPLVLGCLVKVELSDLDCWWDRNLWAGKLLGSEPLGFESVWWTFKNLVLDSCVELKPLMELQHLLLDNLVELEPLVLGCSVGTNFFPQLCWWYCHIWARIIRWDYNL